MRTRQRGGGVARQLQTLYNIGAIGQLTDGQLLERFATDGGEAAELAFSALVERHESLVWRVCQATVRDEHDAEDAFQATFLILVRKARSLWVRDSIGPWLHQVAWRTAICVRRTGNRQRKHVRCLQDRASSRFFEFESPRDHDRDAAIHEAVNGLPEKYRAPIVLCDLQGRSHQEAARYLGWPIGTVKSRQASGRGLIRERLARRGIGLAVAGSIVESFGQNAFAAAPKDVSIRAINAATIHLARVSTSFAISAQVLSVAREVLRTMTWIRYRALAATALAIGLVSGGATFYSIKSPAEVSNPTIGDQPSTAAAQAPGPTRATKPANPQEPGTPQARLLAQRLATRKARAHYEIARLTREIAEISLQEYAEVTYPQDMVSVDGEVKIAETDLKRGEDRLDWARRMFDKGYVSQAAKTSEELALKKARFSLEQAVTKKTVLAEYTRAKTLKELRSDVEKARTDELDRQASWEQQKAKERDLERLLGK